MPAANGLFQEPPTGGVFGSGFGGPRNRKFEMNPPLPKSVAAAFTPTKVVKKIPAPARITVLFRGVHAKPIRGENLQYCGFSWYPPGLISVNFPFKPVVGSTAL